jgi:uncharacterized protein (DUF488 family)
MRIYTIGFTQKSAEEFFNLVKANGIERLVDIRIHPGGQLAGFAKDRDLAYFLKELSGIEYIYLPELAPEAEMMKTYREKKDWFAYEVDYKQLLKERNLPAGLDKKIFEEKVCCLLCSEAEPDLCHRRLAAEMMKESWKDVEIIHI